MNQRLINNFACFYLGFIGINHGGVRHGQQGQHHVVDAAVPAPVLNLPLTVDSGMHAILRKVREVGSGLEVKDRTWLKLKIPNAFLGSDLVEWLHTKVEGFQVFNFFYIILCFHGTEICEAVIYFKLSLDNTIYF
jgi:hypothetical protein